MPTGLSEVGQGVPARRGGTKAARRLVAAAVALLLLAACHRERPAEPWDLGLRSRVDAFNKAAFLNRYDDPPSAIRNAYCALELLNDSLPQYYDGLLRAYNNMAFGYYMLAVHDSAMAYTDRVDRVVDSLPAASGTRNAEVECFIAQLMQIRLLQRGCRIAESYQLLYDIDQSRLLRQNSDNYLYSYAQMEYYITSLTLNYHYRNSAIASSSGTQLTPGTKRAMRQLLATVEKERRRYRCDYAEEMALNYAMAHCYYRLAAASGSDPRLLGRCYDNLYQTLRILNMPNHSSIYHLANVFQLQAFIVADTNIVPEAYLQHCQTQLQRLDSLGCRLYPADSMYVDGEYGLDMFRISTQLFFSTPDPYQHLGAVVAAAEYCLDIGDRERARQYYDRVLSDTTWHDGMAPKFESMLYDGLIRMNYSDDPSTFTQWYRREMELLSFIRENESADALLQDRLDESETHNRYYVAAICIFIPFLILLSVLVLLLVNRSRRLKVEKEALQEAKRQDVERIANVETCLSVMRHDINPFLSYLQNKQLPPELRQEVLDQLLRTFANIKNWTKISIPNGTQFQVSTFGMGEVMEGVRQTCINVHEGVELLFAPTGLRVVGDRQLLEILLRNLVNNALQHTREGQVAVAAEEWGENPRFVHLTVADTGSGMDEATLDGLFRADKIVEPSAGADHGTGFGLMLCKYIIKRHDDNTLRGCRLWVESRLGEGTVMHVLVAKAE